MQWKTTCTSEEAALFSVNLDYLSINEAKRFLDTEQEYLLNYTVTPATIEDGEGDYQDRQSDLENLRLQVDEAVAIFEALRDDVVLAVGYPHGLTEADSTLQIAITALGSEFEIEKSLS